MLAEKQELIPVQLHHLIAYRDQLQATLDWLCTQKHNLLVSIRTQIGRFSATGRKEVEEELALIEAALTALTQLKDLAQSNLRAGCESETGHRPDPSLNPQTSTTSAGRIITDCFICEQLIEVVPGPDAANQAELGISDYICNSFKTDTSGLDDIDACD